jgi:ferric-dicitrate binding protein FerR (iron transport regulator)
MPDCLGPVVWRPMESDFRLKDSESRALILLGLTLLFSLILVMASKRAAQAQGMAKVGLVTQTQGSATLIRGGQTMKVAPSMAVEANDKLVTGADGHLTVTFGDNSTLALGESSTIVINESVVSGQASTITRVGLLGGHLHSMFNAGLRRIDPFEVHTPNAIAGVRGTDFEIAYITGKPCPGFPNCLRYTDVGVHKGRVEVSNPLNPKAAPVIATAGYETTVPCEEPPATPSPLGMDQMLSPAYR